MMDLCGKSVITRTYNAVINTNLFTSTIVVTQDLEIYQEIISNNGNSLLIEKEYNSGTDRIAEACIDIGADVIINIQGDEPFINKSSLEALINIFTSDIKKKINYASLMKEVSNDKEINDPNNVKVSVDDNNYALNFSRKPIYSISDLDKNVCYKHIGVYGYRKEALINLSKLPQTELELFEKIEALRIVESGENIKMVEVLTESVGIDTKEDLEKAVDIWKNK